MGRAFVDFYREHMIKEERDFFLEAERCFTAEEWLDLAAEVSDATDPVFPGEAGSTPAAPPPRVCAFQTA